MTVDEEQTILYLRNVQGYGRNYKRVCRIYCELELSLRIKPMKRQQQDTPEPLAVPDTAGIEARLSCGRPSHRAHVAGWPRRSHIRLRQIRIEVQIQARRSLLNTAHQEVFYCVHGPAGDACITERLAKLPYQWLGRWRSSQHPFRRFRKGAEPERLPACPWPDRPYSHAREEGLPILASSSRCRVENTSTARQGRRTRMFTCMRGGKSRPCKGAA